MKKQFKKAGKALACMLGMAVLMTAIVPAKTTHAEDIYPGFYSVTVVPTYQNPDTGLIDDVGQNPGIGNMMVQAQVQPVGYVEIEEDGTIWLNTRWNQADASIYAGFETSSDGSATWTQREFEVTNQMYAGDYEFMGNTFNATVTDYRFQLDTLNDTIRCTNYVEAMDRECIWFCYITDLVEGVGDEWTVVQEPDMADYTASISQMEPEQEESGAPVVSSSKSAAPAASNAPEASSTEGPEIKDRKVKDAKVNEPSSASQTDKDTGIVGMDAKDKKAEGGISGAQAAVILVAGLLVGGAVVGGVICIKNKRKKGQTDLFSDVDENAEENKEENKEEK